MAKLVKEINAEFYGVLNTIEQGIQDSSISSTLEDSCDFKSGNSKCSVRVFERYSYMGGNRVSMNVTLYQEGDGPVHLCAITSGGSQAVLFKINTIGESSFLAVLEDILYNEYKV